MKKSALLNCSESDTFLVNFFTNQQTLNTIRYGMSNVRIEATYNKIKLIIRKVYESRNIQKMLNIVYLVCSDIRIPLPNRKLNAA